MADRTIEYSAAESDRPTSRDRVYTPNGHKPPVGVPNELIEKFRGKFDDGYDMSGNASRAPERAGDRHGDTESRTRSMLPSWIPSPSGQEGRFPLDGVFCGASGTPSPRSAASSRRSRGPANSTTRSSSTWRVTPGRRPGRPARHVNKLSHSNGVPESLEDLADRSTASASGVARLLSRRVGLRDIDASCTARR